MRTDHKPYGDAVFEFLGRGYLVDSKNRELNFEKVGTGFSQVIPILAALSVDQTLIYKQPEVHLHPKLQSKVADCFVQIMNRKRDSIFSRKIRLIETHSEHFVLRVLKRLRDSFADEIFHSSLTVYPKDLAILYFQPDIDKSIGKLPLYPEWRNDLLRGVMIIKGTWADGTPLTAIPNFARNNRIAVPPPTTEMRTTTPTQAAEPPQRLTRGVSSIVWIKAEK